VDYRYVGVVTHYFARIGVAVVLLADDLYVDDWVMFTGPHTEFQQQIYSMQINHAPIDKGLPSEEVAIKVEDVVREGDEMYLIVE